MRSITKSLLAVTALCGSLAATSASVTARI